MVWHIMSGFAHAGFRDFVLCLGYRSDVFKQYFMNLSSMLGDVTVDLAKGTAPVLHNSDAKMDWCVTMAETGLDSMTGHRVKRAGQFIPSEDDIFAVTYGDGVSDLNFNDVVRFHRRHGKLATVTAVHPPARFGELTIDKRGQVGEFNEKPQASGGWISGGFFVFSRTVLERLPDDAGLMLEREPLQSLASEGELMAYQHAGFWYCMDTARDHATLEELWNSGHPPWSKLTPG